MDMGLREFPTGVLQLVNLRYLTLNIIGEIPSGISRLWNLQTLIILSDCNIPREIWEMPELRYLKVDREVLLDYKYMGKILQRKLQGISLMKVTSSLIKRDFFKSFPNIRKLEIYDAIKKSFAFNLSHLHKLETLICKSDLPSPFLKGIGFPPNIRKLTLDGCVILPLVTKTLCALPNLQVLKIQSCAFEGEEWEAEDGDEFRSLVYLSLDDLNLVRWRADETNFPRLRHLKLNYCRALEEVPEGIGEIMTLQLIHLHWCAASADASARQIQEVQRSDYDNYGLKLLIESRQ